MLKQKDSTTGKLPVGLFNPIKTINTTNKIIIEALEHMDYIFQLEKTTGDFPEPDWEEAKILVYKALDALKSEGKSTQNPCVSCECVKCLNTCGGISCWNCVNYSIVHKCDKC